MVHRLITTIKDYLPQYRCLCFNYSSFIHVVCILEKILHVSTSKNKYCIVLLCGECSDKQLWLVSKRGVVVWCKIRSLPHEKFMEWPMYVIIQLPLLYVEIHINPQKKKRIIYIWSNIWGTIWPGNIYPIFLESVDLFQFIDILVMYVNQLRVVQYGCKHDPLDSAMCQKRRSDKSRRQVILLWYRWNHVRFV